MKKQSQFWTLFKNEAFALTSQVNWLIGWFFSISILLYMIQLHRETYDLIFNFGEITMPLFFLIFLIGVCIVFIMVSGPLEFIFTRSINRRIYFRAKSTVFFLMVIIPLLLSLKLSFSNPKLAMRRSDADYSASGITEGRFLKIFPGSYVEYLGVETVRIDGSRYRNDLIIIPTGRTIRALWALWLGLFVAIIFQGYLIWISRYQLIQRVALMYLGSFFIMFLLFPPDNSYAEWGTLFGPIWQESFLFFSAHIAPMFLGLIIFGIIIQILCERRFEKLEVL